MEEKNEKEASAELMKAVYKNAKMGEEAITTLIGKAKDARMRDELTCQLDSFYGIETAAKNKLEEFSEEAKAPGFLEKLPADISIRMNTLVDSSGSKIAELMISGYNMGIVELQKGINHAKENGVPQEVMAIADGAIAFSQGSIEQMKQYL